MNQNRNNIDNIQASFDDKRYRSNPQTVIVGSPIVKTGTYICWGCGEKQKLMAGDICPPCPNCKTIVQQVVIMTME